MTAGPADGGPDGPVFDPPLSFPTPPPVEGEDGGHRKRVLWAFGAAAALFGAGIVGLSLPTNKDDGVNVKTDDTVGPTTTTDSPAIDRTRSLVAPVFAPFTFSASGVANTTTVPTGNPNGTLPSVSPKTLAALAGVVAKGATNITLTPPAPVTNTPMVQPNNAEPGTSAPGTTTGPTSPPTTKPPKPTTTTTTAPPTTPAPTTTEPPTTIIDTTTTVPETTTIPDTTTTTPDTTTTTEPATTTTEATTTTTTVAATTTSFDPPTTPAPTEPPTTPAPTDPPTTPAPTDPPTTPPTVPFI